MGERQATGFLVLSPYLAVIFRELSLWPGLGRILKRSEYYFWSAPLNNMIFGDDVTESIKLQIYMFLFPEFLLRIIKTSINKLLRFFSKITELKNTLYMFCFVICLFVCVFVSVKLQDQADLTVLSFYQQAVDFVHNLNF